MESKRGAQKTAGSQIAAMTMGWMVVLLLAVPLAVDARALRNPIDTKKQAPARNLLHKLVLPIGITVAATAAIMGAAGLGVYQMMLKPKLIEEAKEAARKDLAQKKAPLIEVLQDKLKRSDLSVEERKYCLETLLERKQETKKVIEERSKPLAIRVAEVMRKSGQYKAAHYEEGAESEDGEGLQELGALVHIAKDAELAASIVNLAFQTAADAGDSKKLKAAQEVLAKGQNLSRKTMRELEAEEEELTRLSGQVRLSNDEIKDVVADIEEGRKAKQAAGGR